MKRYLLQVLIALDQLVCAILGGWADETLSSYAYRMHMQGKPWGRIWRPVIDWIAARFGDQDHCHQAYESERTRAQLPPILRS